MKKRFTILFLALLVTGWVGAQRMAVSAGVQHYSVQGSYLDYDVAHPFVAGGNVGVNFTFRQNHSLNLLFGAASNRLFASNPTDDKIDMYRSDFVYRRYHKFNETFSVFGQTGTSIMRLHQVGIATMAICFEGPSSRPSTIVIPMLEKKMFFGGIAGIGFSARLTRRIALETQISGTLYPQKETRDYLIVAPNFSLLYGL